MSTQVLGDVQLVTKKELEAALDVVVIPESTIDSKIEAAKSYTDTQIETAKELLRSEISVVNTNLTTDIIERKAKDAELLQMIKDEAQLREDTDDTMLTRIVREEGERKTADEQIIELIKSETTERKTANETLQRNIEELSLRIDPATSQLTQLIATEEQARVIKDTELEAKITQNTADIATEIIDRTAADKVLDDKIEALKNTTTQSFEDTVMCTRLVNLPLAQITIENHDHTIAVGDVIGTVSAEYLPKTPVTLSFVTEVDNDDGTTGYAYISARMNANGEVTVINKTILTDSYKGNIGSATTMYITKE